MTIETLNGKAGLPELVGSINQAQWAADIRDRRLFQAEMMIEEPGMMGVTRQQAREYLKGLRHITSAHWWIETRVMKLKSFMLVSGDEGMKPLHVTPPKSDEAAQRVLAEATLAPPEPRGPVAEISLATGMVRVVLIEFDEDANKVLKRSGYRWDEPAWVREPGEETAEHRAAEIAVRLLEHGCPVRIFDEALRKRVIENDYEPEPSRRVEISTSEKYSAKFHLVWALDAKPNQCKKLAEKLRGAKVFDDGAYVGASHYEDIEDFAQQNSFVIASQAQAMIDGERQKILGAIKVSAKPKEPTQPMPAKRALPSANGEIDADLLDD